MEIMCPKCLDFYEGSVRECPKCQTINPTFVGRKVLKHALEE